MPDIPQLRYQIYQNLWHSLSQNDQSLTDMYHLTESQFQESWWLLGTKGCHLCDDAQQMLRLFSSVHPINVVTLDIADFDEALMMQFATHIPVILTPTQQLLSPFSVIELQQLL